MNRLVLIGNGFDLAHGLPTSYQDFIKWYWNKRRDGFVGNTTQVSEDILCKIQCWSHSLNEAIFNDAELKNASGLGVFDYFIRRRQEYDVEMSSLFERIMKNVNNKNWLGIENDYYNDLVYNSSSASKVNKQLKYLKKLLIEYLKNIDYDKILKKNYSIKDYIMGGLDPRRDYSISGRPLYKRLPSYDMIENIMILSFNYTKTPTLYKDDDRDDIVINYIHGELDKPDSVIFGYGDELDKGYNKLRDKNYNECLRYMKSIKYLESDNYRQMLDFIESAPFQILIMGHSCGISDRTLLNTLFEHKNCVSIKPFYYKNEKGKDNYLDLTINISRNFTDMKLMRDRVVNKTYCEPLTWF